MKACIIIENEVCWLVNEDGKKLMYLTNEELADLYYSCSFAMQETHVAEHGADDWQRAFELDNEPEEGF